MSLGKLANLSELLDEPERASGPIELAMDLIDEDPEQPRHAGNPGFSPESIAEIGETIKARGVKSPISVRENPDSPGRYLINHGARRYRGSKWAGRTTIPAFIDNDYSHTDQVIENIQRDGLTAREIADFIGRELSRGKKKGEIAKSLGKSPAFVTQHVTLLDLPDPVARAFNAGRVTDVTLVGELVKAHKQAPAETEDWLSNEGQEVTRGTVKLFREFLDARDGATYGQDEHAQDSEGAPRAGDQEQPEPTTKKVAESDPNKLKRAIILVKHDERMARLVTARRPSAEGLAWIKYDDDGHELEVDLGSVQLMAVMEG